MDKTLKNVLEFIAVGLVFLVLVAVSNYELINQIILLFTNYKRFSLALTVLSGVFSLFLDAIILWFISDYIRED